MHVVVDLDRHCPFRLAFLQRIKQLFRLCGYIDVLKIDLSQGGAREPQKAVDHTGHFGRSLLNAREAMLAL